jgi:hypothetical protein
MHDSSHRSGCESPKNKKEKGSECGSESQGGHPV